MLIANHSSVAVVRRRRRLLRVFSNMEAAETRGSRDRPAHRVGLIPPSSWAACTATFSGSIQNRRRGVCESAKVLWVRGPELGNTDGVR